MAVTYGIDNLILRKLPAEEQARILANSDVVEIQSGQTLYQPGDTVAYAYFPHDAMIMQMASMQDGTVVEIAAIGCEGVLGIQGMLGATRTEKSAVVQIPGRCTRIKIEALRREFDLGGVLQRRLLRYTLYLLSHMSQRAACNRIHPLQQRFCLWLLSIHELIGDHTFPATHETISESLGAPRSEVSLAAKELRLRGLIVYHRGVVSIKDAEKIKALVCECYFSHEGELSSLRSQYGTDAALSLPMRRLPITYPAPRIPYRLPVSR
jgi:CRP-like cAMP-binding protein